MSVFRGEKMSGRQQQWLEPANQCDQYAQQAAPEGQTATHFCGRLPGRL